MATYAGFPSKLVQGRGATYADGSWVIKVITSNYTVPAVPSPPGGPYNLYSLLATVRITDITTTSFSELTNVGVVPPNGQCVQRGADYPTNGLYLYYNVALWDVRGLNGQPGNPCQCNCRGIYADGTVNISAVRTDACPYTNEDNPYLAVLDLNDNQYPIFNRTAGSTPVSAYIPNFAFRGTPGLTTA